MSQKSGFQIQEVTPTLVRLSRQTRESRISAVAEKADTIVFRFKTGIAFLDHMLEHVAWRSGFNLEVSYETAQFNLTHVVWEDVGIVLGAAFRSLVEKNMENGIDGKGDSVSGIDEALALASLSFEGRSGCFLDFSAMPGAQVLLVEDAKSWDIRQFFDGFSQGARATVHLRGFSGEDPHHSWEAVFRAFGEALGKVFISNPRRRGTIPGVKGTFD